MLRYFFYFDPGFKSFNNGIQQILMTVKPLGLIYFLFLFFHIGLLAETTEKPEQTAETNLSQLPPDSTLYFEAKAAETTEAPVSLTKKKEYYEHLFKKALAKKIHQSRYWHLLLHYKSAWGSEYKSEADGENFFMAADGRRNPQAELKQTLHGFLFGDSQRPAQQHPQCRYPARYHWLNEQLQFDNQIMPRLHCQRFNTWINALNTDSITLVFSSYYINNPASMFGHTLIKVNNRNNTNRAEVLDYAINYAANPTTDNALFYSVMGVFGGFPGTFSIFPYYMKLNEYNDFESRDIWEYKLNLKQKEVDRFMRHLWELGSTWFSYFYFDENCSYQLLSLLEISRPSLELTNKFFYVVEPADTIKLIARQPGLISETKYRPSLRSAFLMRLKNLDAAEKNLFEQLLADRQIPADLNDRLPEQKESRVIDTLIDYYYFKMAGRPESLDKDQSSHKTALLKARASYQVRPVKTDDLKKIKTATNPIDSHDSAQVRISGGTSNKGRFTRFYWSPSLRFLHDRATGYSPYSKLFMGATDFTWYPENNETPHLNYFHVIDILSLSPMKNHIYKPSWQVTLGFESIFDELKTTKDPDQIYGMLKVGFGFTLETPDSSFFKNFSFYFIPTARLEVAAWYNNTWRLGPSVLTGILYRIAHNFSIYAESDYRFMYISLEKQLWFVEAGFNWSVNKRLAITSEYRFSKTAENQSTALSLKYYF